MRVLQKCFTKKVDSWFVCDPNWNVFHTTLTERVLEAGEGSRGET